MLAQQPVRHLLQRAEIGQFLRRARAEEQIEPSPAPAAQPAAATEVPLLIFVFLQRFITTGIANTGMK